MSTNCAVYFANLLLFTVELSFATSFHTYIPHTSRYINDLFVVTHLSLDQVTLELKPIYSSTGLTFSSSKPFNNNTVFLDLQLPSKQPTSHPLAYGLFCKPYSCFHYPKPTSYIPLFIYKGLVITESFHIQNQCSSIPNMAREFRTFQHLMQLRGHNPRQILNTLKFFNKNQKNHNKQKICFHMVTDFNQYINYSSLNTFLQNITPGKKRISI